MKALDKISEKIQEIRNLIKVAEELDKLQSEINRKQIGSNSPELMRDWMNTYDKLQEVENKIKAQTKSLLKDFGYKSKVLNQRYILLEQVTEVLDRLSAKVEAMKEITQRIYWYEEDVLQSI